MFVNLQERGGNSPFSLFCFSEAAALFLTWRHSMNSLVPGDGDDLSEKMPEATEVLKDTLEISILRLLSIWWLHQNDPWEKAYQNQTPMAPELSHRWGFDTNIIRSFPDEEKQSYAEVHSSEVAESNNTSASIFHRGRVYLCASVIVIAQWKIITYSQLHRYTVLEVDKFLHFRFLSEDLKASTIFTLTFSGLFTSSNIESLMSLKFTLDFQSSYPPRTGFSMAMPFSNLILSVKYLHFDKYNIICHFYLHAFLQ